MQTLDVKAEQLRQRLFDAALAYVVSLPPK